MSKLLNPQQEAFLSYYTNPKSDTFGNAYQSAKKAGYAEEYSQNITNAMPEWLSENVDDMKRLRRAEKNLNEVQELPIVDEEGKIDIQLIEKRSKIDMFVLERLNKQKYSARVEQTGADGKDLISSETQEIVNKALNEYLNGRTETDITK